MAVLFKALLRCHTLSYKRKRNSNYRIELVLYSQIYRTVLTIASYRIVSYFTYQKERKKKERKETTTSSVFSTGLGSRRKRYPTTPHNHTRLHRLIRVPLSASPHGGTRLHLPASAQHAGRARLRWPVGRGKER